MKKRIKEIENKQTNKQTNKQNANAQKQKTGSQHKD